VKAQAAEGEKEETENKSNEGLYYMFYLIDICCMYVNKFESFEWLLMIGEGLKFDPFNVVKNITYSDKQAQNSVEIKLNQLMKIEYKYLKT